MVWSQDAVEAWESTYEQVLLGMDEGVCLIERTSADPGREPDYRYLWTNPAFTTHSGVSDAVGRTLREIVPADEADGWCATYDEVWLDGNRARFTKSLTSQGRIQELTAFTVPPRGEHGPVLAVVFTDITGDVLHQAMRTTRERELNEIAATLQHAILGPTTSLPAGIAARYRPATDLSPGADPLLVCGDFHDVVVLPGGRCALVVGDVTGKGLRAASVMGQLRSATRALALEDRGPAHTLTALDGFALLMPEAHMTTIVCAVVDTGTGEVVYASAGHPPPVLTDGHRARLLPGTGEPPLATLRGLRRTERRERIDPGGALLLYTDGLVERRDQIIDRGIDRAALVLTTLATLSADTIADRLLDLMPPSDPPDDTALVVYRHHR
ncbi:PP2C family protein-serine/threonine phosphatase [Actinokineospora pegani]|uniref:PP2C family protein-serine/threonine phosphatase n=1 Tax=Actinokineospora pegani TaxID=2654637 RepID=UPI0012EB00D2|nr:SpoIIE family protein phosphatase [Actinokineospora pegani]